jgi:HEAT repeat protein
MIELAIERLTHEDPAVRYEAAQTLGASKDSRAVEPLMTVLPDANSKVQYAALSGLVKLGDARAAVPILETLLANPHSRLWELMKLNIGMRLRFGLLDMIESGNRDITDMLVAALHDRALDDPQRAFIIQLLGRTQDRGVVETLIEMTLAETLTIRSAAAESLGWIGDQRAVAPLLATMNDVDNTMREVAAEALGRLKDTRAVEPLIAALHDEDEWVRRAAAVGLGELGDRRAMDALADAMRDPVEMVQDAAFDAIKQLSDDRYTTIL